MEENLLQIHDGLGDILQEQKVNLVAFSHEAFRLFALAYLIHSENQCIDIWILNFISDFFFFFKCVHIVLFFF